MQSVILSSCTDVMKPNLGLIRPTRRAGGARAHEQTRKSTYIAADEAARESIILIMVVNVRLVVSES